MPSSSNAIQAEHLTKRFRRVRGYLDLLRYPTRDFSDAAVDDVSIAVRAGELFGILGENGAGKTTLIRMLSTTLLPTSGRAWVSGHDVVREPQAVRRLIGLVSGDERSFYWRLTGRQNLSYFAALYHVPRASTPGRIAELLASLGVERYADRRFDSYSTGIRQKFAIARGMLTEPHVLFLDEPTRALDPIAADEVRRLVREHIVSELGYTVLLATHTLTEAEAICDRIAIMRGGKLVEMGSVEELRHRMGLAAVLECRLRGQADGLVETLRRLSGVVAVDRVAGDEPDESLAVRLHEDPGVVDSVLRAIVGAGAQVAEVTTRRPTLDDIYRAAHVPEGAG